MWDDAIHGRQTKRKWNDVWLLAALSLLLLAGGLLMARPELVERAADLAARLRPGVSDQWNPLPGACQTCAGAGDALICAGNGQVWAVDTGGKLLWRQALPGSEYCIETWEDRAAVWVPGGRNLLLAGKDGCRTLTVSRTIDRAVPGPRGAAAVITTGPGYLTETRLYDGDGTLARSVGLTDRAMTTAVFLPDGALASLCVDTAGRWTLRLDRAGEITEQPLSCSLAYDMKPCGRGVALWTSDGVSFYDRNGGETGSYPLHDRTVLDWTCGAEAAFLVRQGGFCRIVAVDRWGGARTSEPLAREPCALTICGDSVCVLDRERLLIYDDAVRLREDSALGARAGQLCPVRGGVLLIGDGAALYHKF